jgi:hypothetical protein
MAKGETPGGGDGNAGGGDERAALLKELRSLIKEVDEEGLRFLVRQAHTMLYNMKVDELNRSREAQLREEGPRESGTRTDRRRKGEGPEVYFEKGRRSGGYILVIDGVRSIMDEAEVLALVRIAQAAASAAEASGRLHGWFEAHRDDILMEVDLRPGGARLAALYECLRRDFAIRS